MTTETVLLHWEGWDRKWDVWIDITKEGQRVKPQGQHTAAPCRPEEHAAEKESSHRTSASASALEAEEAEEAEETEEAAAAVAAVAEVTEVSASETRPPPHPPHPCHSSPRSALRV